MFVLEFIEGSSTDTCRPVFLTWGYCYPGDVIPIFFSLFTSTDQGKKLLFSRSHSILDMQSKAAFKNAQL